MLRIIIAIAVMTAATMLTRFFPFIIFSKKEPPKWMLSGAKLIPGAVMMVLVVTSLPHNLAIRIPETWIPFAGVASVTILHLIFKHPLVSIFGGTTIYMLLLNFFG
ncbi:MAG: AzlD domain-containing protein [Spirochaetales bacterium]|nr:AzlD domain-containing protein [Spirochaetales bacterium]